MNSVLFITFDVKKDDYPEMSYSVASLIAVLKKSNVKTGHYPVDIQRANEEKASTESLTFKITNSLKNNLDYFKKFSFLAIGLTSWSTEYCKSLLEMLDDYNGKVIMGGYEITSMSRDALFRIFPRADYFIKGYAEKALKNIIVDKVLPTDKIIQEKIDAVDLESPYLTGVINIFSKKIYWETKRGCQYKCGFCEWGNLITQNLEIDLTRLEQEIKLFSQYSIDEINILDGTFNSGRNYLALLKLLLEIEDVKITFQARFENLLTPKGREFLEICHENRHRIHLEFGLQTIHEEEMQTIGRENDLKKVEKALNLLNNMKLDYEVSLIYAIPGQTVESFIDSIEFLITRGCKTIKAFPLMIPKNSKMEERRIEMGVIDAKNKYNVKSVGGSYSFSFEQREDMDVIANKLNNGQINTDISTISNDYFPEKEFDCIKITPYQWEIVSFDDSSDKWGDLYGIIDNYIKLTQRDIQREDPRQYAFALGSVYSRDQKYSKDLIREILAGEFTFKLGNWEIPDLSTVKDKIVVDLLKKVNPDIKPKKYRCKVRVSISRNFYGYREIEFI